MLAVIIFALLMVGWFLRNSLTYSSLQDIGDRQRKRDAAAKNEEWQKFLAVSKPFLRNQVFLMFLPKMIVAMHTRGLSACLRQ